MGVAARAGRLPAARRNRSNTSARSATTSFNLTGGGEPLRVLAAQVQPAVFARARRDSRSPDALFTADEDRPGHEHVVVLGEGLWRIAVRLRSARSSGARFSSTPRRYTVVGVLPAALRLPLDYASRAFTQLWVPLALGPTDPQERGNHGLNALGRSGARRRRSRGRRPRSTRSRAGFQQRFPNQLRPRVRPHARAGAARGVRRRSGPRCWCCCWPSARCC